MNETTGTWEERQEATEGVMDQLSQDPWLQGQTKRVVSSTNDNTRAAEAMNELVSELAERQGWNLEMRYVDWRRVTSWARVLRQVKP